MLKKMLAIMLSTLFLFQCASVSRKQKKIVENIDTEREIEKIVEKRNPTKKDTSDTISIYQGTDKIGELTLNEFQTIVKASSQYEQILEAEKDGRVYVIFEKNPWELTPGKEVSTKVFIIWKTKEKTVLKKVAIKLKMSIPKEGKVMNKFRVLYRSISEVAFPVTLGVLIIVLGLVLGL